MGILALTVLAISAPGAPAAAPRECDATTRLAGETIVFEVKCPFPVVAIRATPDGRVSWVARNATVRRGERSDEMRCRVPRSRQRVVCLGRAAAGAVVAGRFRVRGSPRSLETAFLIEPGKGA